MFLLSFLSQFQGRHLQVPHELVRWASQQDGAGIRGSGVGKMRQNGRKLFLQCCCVVASFVTLAAAVTACCCYSLLLLQLCATVVVVALVLVLVVSGGGVGDVNVIVVGGGGGVVVVVDIPVVVVVVVVSSIYCCCYTKYTVMNDFYCRFASLHCRTGATTSRRMAAPRAICCCTRWRWPWSARRTRPSSESTRPPRTESSQTPGQRYSARRPGPYRTSSPRDWVRFSSNLRLFDLSNLNSMRICPPNSIDRLYCVPWHFFAYITLSHCCLNIDTIFFFQDEGIFEKCHFLDVAALGETENWKTIWVSLTLDEVRWGEDQP